MAGGWKRFATVLAATALGSLTAAAAAIALIDPLAISPIRIISDEVLPQTNRRFIAPAIVRSGRYDSHIVGTSTVHTLDPERVARTLQGRFANLALFASTPYEQARLVELIARQGPRLRFIVWGLDAVWCSPSQPARHGPETFPEWLYDDDRWNDLSHAFNWSTLDLARRKLGQTLRPSPKRLRPDGYVNMLPPDAGYSLDKAQKAIYRSAQPRRLTPAAPEAIGSPDAGVELPGAIILRDVLARLPQAVRLVFVLMPEHAVGIPEPGSVGGRAMETCKAAIAAAAARRGDWVIDAKWRSAWTVEDGNFWDAMHFRDHIAEGLIAGIDAAVNRQRAEPAMALRLLARGR